MMPQALRQATRVGLGRVPLICDCAIKLLLNTVTKAPLSMELLMFYATLLVTAEACAMSSSLEHVALEHVNDSVMT